MNNCTSTSDLRPISIYSLFYRWWATTWATSALVTNWRETVLPDSIVGGPGSAGAEELASRLADNLVNQGFLATLDYSLAFDRCNPEVISAAMTHLGLPPGLVTTVRSQWTRQRRYLQWKASVPPTPLQTNMCIPQATPLSPLALNILMLTGLGFTNRHCPAEPRQRTQVIYMDDRSWSANSPGILMGALQYFSTRLGLKENLPKTQITYASEQYQQELLQFMGNSPFRPYVRSSVCILGACATGVPRTDLHDKEQQRLDDALQTLDRIRLLPLDHQTILHTARTTAVAKAAFGWVANSPQTQHVTKFNTSLRHCGQYMPIFSGGVRIPSQSTSGCYDSAGHCHRIATNAALG